MKMNEYEKTEEEKSQLGQSIGAKFDDGKSRWDLIPADVLLEVSKEVPTFLGLFQKEKKLKTFEEKMMFYYSNGMEAAWLFWNGINETPFNAGVRTPLVFSIINYIHLLDLCLIYEEHDKNLDPRIQLYNMDIPDSGGMYLLPYKVIDYLGLIYLYGCKKYDENNWRKGMPWGKIFAAFNRHSGQWHGGEAYDKESGMHHIGHALWQLFGLRWYEQYTPVFDDRWKNRAKK
jgi:hypothetical protein